MRPGVATTICAPRAYLFYLSENICAAVNRHNIQIVDVPGKVSQIIRYLQTSSLVGARTSACVFDDEDRFVE